MTREDILRIAQEVGFVAYGEDIGEYRIPVPAFQSRLERFAALVAEAERAACLELCEVERNDQEIDSDRWLGAKWCVDDINARSRKMKRTQET